MMERERISYTLKKSFKLKKLRICIQKTGKVLVTAPFFLSKKYIDAFIKTQNDWIVAQQARMNSLQKIPTKSSVLLFKKNKSKTLELVQEKIEKINTFYNFSYKKISIRNQKTRWGSCSSKSNLSFNYKLLFLPNHLIDYVITHELCHLKEMNHGKNFWKLIEQTIPDYKEHHQELKKFKV